MKPNYLNDKTSPDFLVRTAFFDEISEQYMSPNALGACRGKKKTWVNMPPAHDFGGWHASFADEVVTAFEDYKFAVVMQNTHTTGGIQEKIVHAWLANAIPIYFGPPEATEQYNPASFVNCAISDIDTAMSKLAKIVLDELIVMFDVKTNGTKPTDVSYVAAQWERTPAKGLAYALRDIYKVNLDDTEQFEQIIVKTRDVLRADFTRCIGEIKRLDGDEEAWMEMATAPVVHNSTLEGSDFDIYAYARKFREVLQNAGSYLV